MKTRFCNLCALALITFLASASMGFAESHSLVRILSPLHGASLTGAVRISIGLANDAEPETLRVMLDGKNISSLFDVACQSGAEPQICVKSVSVNNDQSLRSGENFLAVSVRGEEGRSSQRLRFDWRAEHAPGVSEDFSNPPAVSFRVPVEEGKTGLFQIGQNTFPDKPDACNTALEVVVLDRTTLAQEKNGIACYDDSASLKKDLQGRKNSDLVIVATTPGKFAPPELDTSAIGGTDFSNRVNYPQYVEEYLIVGAGGAPAGEATENYNTATIAAAPFQYAPFLMGILAMDENQHYSYHPSDIRPFVVNPNDPMYGTSSITIGDQVYSAPAGSHGFWLLTVDAMLLQPIDSRMEGGTTCVYSSNKNLGTCGKYYDTGSPDPARAMVQQQALAIALNSQDKRNLMFLTSVGTPFQLFSLPGITIPQVADLGIALSNMGASDYMLHCSTCTRPQTTATYTLISSQDPDYSKILNGKTVFSSNFYSQQGQTGYVRGLLTRRNNSLFQPGLYAQESAAQNPAGCNGADCKGEDFTFPQVVWAFPVAWPLTDSNAHIAAYQAVSTAAIGKLLPGAVGNHLNDIRYYYTGSLQAQIAAGASVVPDLPYPGDGHIFSLHDWCDAKKQISDELTYLSVELNWFGPSWMGKVVVGNENSVTASIAEATADLNASVVEPAANAQLGLNTSGMLNLAAGVLAIPGVFVQPFGVLSGILWSASAIGGVEDTPDAVASSEYTIYTSVADSAKATSTYIQSTTAAYDLLQDNVFSDWYKLSTVYRHVSDTSDPWYFSNKTLMDGMAQQITAGAARNAYWQLIPQKYKRDVFENQPTPDPGKIGSWFLTSCGKSGCMTTCTAYYGSHSLPQGDWLTEATQSSQNNIYVFSQGVSNNYSNYPSEMFPDPKVIATLTGDSDGDLNLPLDFILSPGSPVPSEPGPAYSKDFCYNLGGTSN